MNIPALDSIAIKLAIFPELSIPIIYGHWIMVFSATFNNISVISWHSVVLVEETGVPEENHRSVSRPTLSHVISSTPIMIRTHNFSGDRH